MNNITRNEVYLMEVENSTSVESSGSKRYIKRITVR